MKRRPYSLFYKYFYRIPLCIIKITINYKKLVGDAKKNTYYPEKRLKTRLNILIDHIKCAFTFGFIIDDDYYPMGIDQKGKNVLEYVGDTMNTVCLYGTCSDYKKSYKNMTYDYLATLRDKWIFSHITDAYNLPTPKNIGLIRNGNYIKARDNVFYDISELAKNNINIIVKPIDGVCGNGIFNLKTHNGKYFVHGNEITISELRELLKNGTYLLQEFISNQHEDMSKLYPDAVNTLRITVANCGDHCEIIGRMVMLGAYGTTCSNWHFGGVSINLKEDGTCDKYGYCKVNKKITSHPNTGIIFENYKIPFFEEAIELAKKATSLFYGFKSIGWDIAITDKGPIIIEGNDNWGIVAHQMVENRGWLHIWEKYNGSIKL